MTASGAILRDFISRHYEAAVIEALNSHEQDQPMIEMMSGDARFKSDHVRDWMRRYSLFQGISATTRERIVSSVRRGRVRWQSSVGILPAERTVHILGQFCRVQRRSWLSAASKIAWCFDPRNTVIFGQVCLAIDYDS